ncbi:CBS domain-containing protein [Desertifilum sp. FACHB-1129]|uniref:Poly(A) polymerase n=1 Tax=Desertifilum tharense IPPAS B-1220 TaxID=1781255 RepID=A0A1E5QEE0_9CYAN|nr:MULTISPECIES: CBS domain-containing protein [Desertifilum]MDA0213426.1 CBS domain-containing protein [Cyanobacteria bacterium FC1]MBD2315230.1 CBS domain-containing protein [Desertifilum sp. FACHB-1129]MBD2322908.1 CBS domain-containing protein [Desertifilum sp. FACHB-866]MBD2335279.1 CBS domain-containing protein [Desertifilum sp. FACHB-868]OEJ73032.1 poly(A) polymerase [Desertifilum tharense IPPAS B-1220]
MDLILCHTTADFDALGAAVGLTRLKPGAKIVLSGGYHPAVREFLALHRDEYALIERRSVNPKQIRSLMVVDTQMRDRLGKTAEWLDLPQLSAVELYDHHLDSKSNIPFTQAYIEAVGATTTLIVEKLQATFTEATRNQPFLSPAEATVMALGIHVDTGSLSYEASTPRDALALAWLMQQGASLSVIADYLDSALSPELQDLLAVALEKLQIETIQGYAVAWVLLDAAGYVPGLSSLAAQLVELTDVDALLLGVRYRVKTDLDERLTIVGRSRIDNINLHHLFQPLGGGGHSQAASLTWRGTCAQSVINQLVEQLKAQIPQPPTARELMSSPVRTILPETTIKQAQRILLRYGHSGLSVVDETGKLIGMISRRDIDIALHHGFSHAPVKGYMSSNLKTISPETPLPSIESLMVTYDIGRLPVLENGQLVGIVTRTDVLRQLHQDKTQTFQRPQTPELHYCPLPQVMGKMLRERLTPQLWRVLTTASQAAQKRGWHLYLVGGGVRDLLLADPTKIIELQDIDLVVDKAYPIPLKSLQADSIESLETSPQVPETGAGVELARELQQYYPNVRLQVHGRFQTAALLWHKDPELGSLWIDIATARTEFYPYPAANPEVEASSIRQDLYRRDFTINALAIRLTDPRSGTLLDFFGGWRDLEAKVIRVLHANSFIEDPTRIYRAVRFAVRLGFQIESQTESYIRYALESGIYTRSISGNHKTPALQTRLKSELKYILQENYWKPALQLLGDLGALRCIHPTLEFTEELWKQMRLVDRCLKRFQPPEESSEQAVIREPWQLLLEVLLAQLAPEHRAKVAENLQLPDESMTRLQRLDTRNQVIQSRLSQCKSPSQIVQLLQNEDLYTLILIAVQSPRVIRKLIWNYITKLSQIQSPLNGNDLKKMGYKPSPKFKQILDRLLAATLDGEITTRPTAEAFLAEKFPVN